MATLISEELGNENCLKPSPNLGRVKSFVLKSKIKVINFARDYLTANAWSFIGMKLMKLLPIGLSSVP